MESESRDTTNLEELFYIPREVPITLLKGILETIYTIQVNGIENIPQTGGAVIVCNHTDILDIPVQAMYSPRKIIFLGKYELFSPQEQIIEYINQPSSPFFSFPLSMTKKYIEDGLHTIGNIYRKQLEKWGSMPVVRNYRGNDAKSAVLYYEELENYMISLVQKGEILSIYPEGTRTESGVMGPFKALAAKIAIRANVPIIPSGINGAWNMSSAKAFLSGEAFKARIRYNIGNPIQPDQFPGGVDKRSAKDLTEELEKRVYFLSQNQERRGKSRKFITKL